MPPTRRRSSAQRQLGVMTRRAASARSGQSPRRVPVPSHGRSRASASRARSSPSTRRARARSRARGSARSARAEERAQPRRGAHRVDEPSGQRRALLARRRAARHPRGRAPGKSFGCARRATRPAFPRRRRDDRACATPRSNRGRDAGCRPAERPCTSAAAASGAWRRRPSIAGRLRRSGIEALRRRAARIGIHRASPTSPPIDRSDRARRMRAKSPSERAIDERREHRIRDDAGGAGNPRGRSEPCASATIAAANAAGRRQGASGAARTRTVTSACAAAHIATHAITIVTPAPTMPKRPISSWTGDDRDDTSGELRDEHVARAARGDEDPARMPRKERHGKRPYEHAERGSRRAEPVAEQRRQQRLGGERERHRDADAAPRGDAKRSASERCRRVGIGDQPVRDRRIEIEVVDPAERDERHAEAVRGAEVRGVDHARHR